MLREHLAQAMHGPRIVRLHAAFRAAHRGRRLRNVEPLEVAQHERFALPRRQLLEGPLERPHRVVGRDLLERILAESRANAFKADLVALPELELSIMIKRKLLVRYEGAENSLYPAETKDPRGYWTGLYTSAWVAGYNTKLLSKDGAPKSYKDLLNPDSAIKI